MQVAASRRVVCLARCQTAARATGRGPWRAASGAPTLRSQLFAPIRDEPRDAQVVSHRLLVRAGYVHQSDAGIYAFLPLGQRVLEKLVAVIDQEMAAVGGQKTSLPLLMSSELWRKTGRWDSTGPELMRLKDRRGSDFCLAPTQEELYTAIVAAAASSYRDLPLFLYQIGRKYRDEARPRHGLLRSREFTMKDLYSFHATREDALEAYERMRAAYERVFARVDLPTVQVTADGGNIGGSLTHEFHVVADAGEDSLLHCGACGYAANAEKAASLPSPDTALPDGFSAAVAAAADANGTVGDLAAAVAGLAATVVAPDPAAAAGSDATPVVVWSHGARTVNELALASTLGDQWHVLKGGQAAAAARASPIRDVAHVLDSSVSDALGALEACGADVRAAGQVTVARAGDGCASDGCEGQLAQSRGIEVGQIFHLGTKYAEALGASVRGAGQAQASVEMGCYGLGVSRMLAAAVEVHHDDRGIKVGVHAGRAGGFLPVRCRLTHSLPTPPLTAVARNPGALPSGGGHRGRGAGAAGGGDGSGARPHTHPRLGRGSDFGRSLVAAPGLQALRRRAHRVPVDCGPGPQLRRQRAVRGAAATGRRGVPHPALRDGRFCGGARCQR